MRRFKLAAAVIGLAAGAAGYAEAGIVLDHSPAAVGGTISGNNAVNMTSYQNFADLVSFASDTDVTGMDIYMSSGTAQIGDTATVRIWSDSGGAPGILLSSFTETISVIDGDGAVGGNQRVHADFTTPYTLAGGTTYWIGMSGTSRVFTQTGIIGGALGSGNMYQFDGTTGLRPSLIGHMAFRLEAADATATPEPSTLASAGLAGLMGLGYAWRRKAWAAAV